MLEIQANPKHMIFRSGDILLIVGSMYLLSLKTNKISQVSYDLNTFNIKIFQLVQKQMKYLLL